MIYGKSWVLLPTAPASCPFFLVSPIPGEPQQKEKQVDEIQIE